MKFLITTLLIFTQLFAFSQTKEDFLTCFEIILEHDDFQPAFENRGITGEDLIIVTNGNRSVNQNALEKIRNSLTADDFYDFSRDIKIIRGNDETLQDQGYNLFHTLMMWTSGNSETLSFRLSTVVENQNLTYNWSFKLVKENEEWTLVGHNVNKTKVR